VKLKVFSIGFKYLQMCATILFRGKPLSLYFLSITLILHYKVLPNISYILYIMLNLKRFSVYLTDNFLGTHFVYALVLYYIEFIICHSKWNYKFNLRAILIELFNRSFKYCLKSFITSKMEAILKMYS
jgi:hypothetical protein